jgi:hypothetical protein
MVLTGDITWGDVTTVAGIVAAAFAIWWRIENRADRAKKAAYFKVDQATTAITAAHATATLAREELAEYKTHVAETYVTKAGMQEQTAQIISAVNGVKSDVSGLNERIDRILENRPPRSGRS